MSTSDHRNGSPLPEKKPSKVEGIKERSHYLREPLLTELHQDTTHFTEEAVQILKFHGSYQQDNRDTRQERRAQGLEREYSMMLRTRIPGGHVHPQFYLTLDHLADTYGNGTLRATNRQTFQLHGVLKQNLKTVIGTIVQQMGSTISACGDVNRNVMAPAAPYKNCSDYVYAQEYACKLADLLTPQSGAYYEIWVDGEPVEIPEDPEVTAARQFKGKGILIEGSPEPLYGQHFLPRKFKAAIGVPTDNTVDIYSQDIGLIVLTDAKDKLLGFNIVVGGGMGRTHNKEETFPLLAQPLGFATPDEIYAVVQAIVAVQRDHGNRSDRRQARMKYLVHNWGINTFRRTVEKYYGRRLKKFRSLPEFQPTSELGWHPQGDGKLFVGIFVENGRIQNTETQQLKTALREIVQRYNLHLRVTPTQDILLVDIDPAWRFEIDTILQTHNILPADRVSPLLRSSMACPALPTCGLAITESERALPDLLRQIDTLLEEIGLGKESIIVRMTGCPNGCARPYLAELGFVGVVPDHYQVWIGGSPRGERLAQLWVEKMAVETIPDQLKPILLAFQKERYFQERFGDYCDRVGLEYLTSLLPQLQVV